MMKKKKSFLFILLTVLFISIGYAYLSSSLNINGLGHLKKSTWNVYFDNVEILEGEDLASKLPTTSTHNTTSIDYTVNFDVPGDIFKFSVDVVNDGTIDAMISLISDTILDDEQKKYASYELTYLDGSVVKEKNYLASLSKDTFLVTISYKEDIDPEDLPVDAKSLEFNLDLEYVQAKDSDKKQNKSIIVKDLSGNNNRAVIYGAKINEDGTVTTDGVDDYIDCGLANYDFGDSFSYVIKTKFIEMKSTDFFGNWEGAGGGFIYSGYLLFDFYIDGVGYTHYRTNYQLLSYTWYTLVATYDGAKLKLYINGEAIPTNDDPNLYEVAVTGKIKKSAVPISIGGNVNYNNSVYSLIYPGKISVASALVFDRALGEEEVARDYGLNINPVDYTDMLFYYQFENE